MPGDRLHSPDVRPDEKRDLTNLRPFAVKHWRKTAFGVLLVLLGAALALPQPLINRYLIDEIIVNQQLHRLVGAVVIMASVAIASKLVNVLQGFYFTRLEQIVILDIQRDLLGHALHFPKSFFDGKEVGYLMARLSSDVQGLRWFFSGTLVYLMTQTLRLVGGIGLLFYLEWRLALAVLFTLPRLLCPKANFWNG